MPIAAGSVPWEMGLGGATEIAHGDMAVVITTNLMRIYFVINLSSIKFMCFHVIPRYQFM